MEGAARRMSGASRRVEIDGVGEKEVAGEVCAAGLRVGGWVWMQYSTYERAGLVPARG